MQKFYTIDFDYLRYMKEADSKVPNFDYDEHDKFFFGVVLQINDMKYFAPISSKKVVMQLLCQSKKCAISVVNK